MTEPMDDFERRLAEDLRRMTDAAPRRADFAEEARLIASAPQESPRWRGVLPLAVATVAAAAVITLAIVDLAPFNRPPTASASPAATPTASASPSASPGPSASGAAVAEIDLSQLAWYDLTHVTFGELTGGQPEPSPRPSPYGELRVGTLDGHLAAELHLEEPSFANGPYPAGVFPAGVLAGQDNGARSQLLLVSPTTGEVRTLFETDALIPVAALSPDGAWIYYVKVDRERPGSAMVWRRPISGGTESRMTSTYGLDAAGAAWSMNWTADGRGMVVQSCIEGRCTAIHNVPAQVTSKIQEVTGEILGLTDTEMVALRSRAPGVVAIDLDNHEVRTIDPAVDSGALARGEAGWYLAYEPAALPTQPRTYRLEAIPLDGGDPRVLVDVSGNDLRPAAVWAPGDRRAILPRGWLLRWPERGGLTGDLRIDPGNWFSGQLVNVDSGQTIRVPPVAEAVARPDCEPIPPTELPFGGPPGDTRITDANGFRFASWGAGTHLVTQVVGATFFAANAGGPETVPVAIRGTTGNLSPSVTPDGPFFVTWQENGCDYEIWLPTNFSRAASIAYAGRY